MKKYILIIFSVIDSREIYEKVETLSIERFNKIKIGAFNLISFDCLLNLPEVKDQLDSVYLKKPLYVLLDATEKGVNFDLSFGKLEDTILLNNVEEVIDIKDMTLDDLLDIVTKKGYSSLTPEQKQLLNKFSGGEPTE